MECPEKVKSPILRQLWHILADGMRRIEDGDDCNEASAMAMMSRYNAECKGFIDNNSTVNYDEAMRTTGIKSRNQLNAICKAHRIEQVKIKNHSVGFLKTEIEDLAQQLRNENKNAGR